MLPARRLPSRVLGSGGLRETQEYPWSPRHHNEEKHKVRLRAFIKEMDNGTGFGGNDNQAPSCGNKEQRQYSFAPPRLLSLLYYKLAEPFQLYAMLIPPLFGSSSGNK